MEMKKEIKKMKYEEQKKLLEKLSSMDPTSDEYDTVLDKIKSIDSMLAKENELEIKQDQNKAELVCKKKQLDGLMKELIAKYGVEVGLAVLSLIFYGHWMNKGFKFEETGALCSFTFKDLISNFKPKRK